MKTLCHHIYKKKTLKYKATSTPKLTSTPNQTCREVAVTMMITHRPDSHLFLEDVY